MNLRNLEKIAILSAAVRSCMITKAISFLPIFPRPKNLNGSEISAFVTFTTLVYLLRAYRHAHMNQYLTVYKFKH